MALAKLTIVIGAGIVGSMLAKEGGLSDIRNIFAGALKIVSKNLQQDKDNSRSTSKPQTDTLLAQVNNLRQELQLLASSRSVTIVTGTRSGSGTYGITAIIVVGVVGYVYIWWKGWKISDMMFVTRRGFSDARASIGKQLELVSSSMAAAKRHLSSRIDRVDSNIDECKELTAATKCEVSKLHGELSGFHVEVESVHRVVQDLETKLGRIEESQDLATRGVYHLCQFVEGLEQSRNREMLQGSLANTPRRAIELPQTVPVTRMGSMPPLALEPPSPSASASASAETPKVVRPSTVVSASGLKELQEISSAIKTGGLRSNSIKAGSSVVSNGAPSIEEPNSSSSSSGWPGWKLPGISVLKRTRSTAS